MRILELFQTELKSLALALVTAGLLYLFRARVKMLWAIPPWFYISPTECFRGGSKSVGDECAATNNIADASRAGEFQYSYWVNNYRQCRSGAGE
jgi:hypothetical protein